MWAHTHSANQVARAEIILCVLFDSCLQCLVCSDDQGRTVMIRVGAVNGHVNKVLSVDNIPSNCWGAGNPTNMAGYRPYS